MLLPTVTVMTLDPNRPLAMWRQLEELLRRQIESGDLQGLMPSEKRLADEHGLSKDTVRKAKKRLFDDGLLTNVNGVGTFVVPAEDRTQN